MKRLMLLLLAFAMILTPVFGASENSVDKVLSVKDDFVFKTDTAHASLRIEEQHPNEFGNENVNFRLKINNAEWIEDGNAGDPSDMENDTQVSGDETISIQRLGDHELEITINRGSVVEEAWWKIPLYAEVSDAGIVSVEVDGRDGLVSSGEYNIAQVPGENYLHSGYRFTPENQQWMTFREPQANAFTEKQVFRLVLENGTWFSDADDRLGTDAMLKNAGVSGIEAGSVSKVQRINDKTIEVTLERGADSSVKASGVWSLPLYFSVDRFGLAKVTIDSLSSDVEKGALSKEKISEPIRYIRTVTLTLGKPEIAMKQGSEQHMATLDVTPVNPDGSTFVPVRGIFEELGGRVSWNAADRTVEITQENTRILLNADSTAATVNGTGVTLSQSPRIINGRLLIPLRSVSEQLGFSVEWLETTKQIIIRQD